MRYAVATGWRGLVGLVVCGLLVPVARGEQPRFDPDRYVAPDATPVDLALARRAVERAAAKQQRLEARYVLYRQGQRIGAFRVRFAAPYRMRLDASVDGHSIVYVITPERMSVRTEQGRIVAELGGLFGGLRRCFERAEALRPERSRAVRPGLGVGFRVRFDRGQDGAGGGEVWAGIEVQRRPRVQLGTPDRLWAERWYAYHEGQTLRFVQPERDLRVERASGVMRSYALRLEGATVRRVELEHADLSPPPFDAAIFTLQGRIDEARSRALGMQTISRCLRGALRMLIDAWAEAKREQRDRAPAVVELSFAEALAGAFGTPLRGELRRAAPVLWEALGAERHAREERVLQLRALLFERLRSMLARARTVHGVDGAAARALLQQAAGQRREVAEAIDPERFGAALDRAERRVVAAVLDAEWDALVGRLAREGGR